MGGTDPIPGLAPTGGTYRNPAIQYQIAGNEWFLYREDGYWSNATAVADATAPFGAYMELDVTAGGLVIIGCPLGPAGSRWRVDIWYSKGPDYGELDLSWQTTPAEVTGVTSEAVTEPYTGDPWYYADAGAAPQIDCYNAGTVITYDTQISLMTPTGADGDMLTADGAPSGVFTNTQEMNGGGDGSVWWWLKAQTATKNASSSGYRARIHLLRIARIAEGGITPL